MRIEIGVLTVTINGQFTMRTSEQMKVEKNISF